MVAPDHRKVGMHRNPSRISGRIPAIGKGQIYGLMSNGVGSRTIFLLAPALSFLIPERIKNLSTASKALSRAVGGKKKI